MTIAPTIHLQCKVPRVVRDGCGKREASCRWCGRDAAETSSSSYSCCQQHLLQQETSARKERPCSRVRTSLTDSVRWRPSPLWGWMRTKTLMHFQKEWLRNHRVECWKPFTTLFARSNATLTHALAPQGSVRPRALRYAHLYPLSLTRSLTHYRPDESWERCFCLWNECVNHV